MAFEAKFLLAVVVRFPIAVAHAMAILHLRLRLRLLRVHYYSFPTDHGGGDHDPE